LQGFYVLDKILSLNFIFFIVLAANTGTGLNLDQARHWA